MLELERTLVVEVYLTPEDNARHVLEKINRALNPNGPAPTSAKVVPYLKLDPGGMCD